MAVLGSLPVELIARIGELTDIDSQLDLALASHYIANALQDLFKRHRFAHKWATCSDVLPLTVPHTLRAVIADPLVASHVRTIHIWCARSQWAEWKPVRQSAPSNESIDIFEPTESTTWSFQLEELNSYLTTLEGFVSDFHPGSELREQARDELSRGDDGILKALLIALSPRLRNVYYAHTSYVPTYAQDGSVGNSSLEWLSRMIMHHRGREFEMWPPGLQSLRHLAIGVDTGTGQPPDRHHQYTPLLLAKMLNLPNLESFYLCGFANMHQDELDYLYDGSVLTPECSSLRHLYLENFWGIDREIWEPILSACKTQLTSLAFYGEAPEDEYEFIMFAQETAQNLQSLMFYDLPEARVEGRNQGFFPPEEILTEHEWRMVTVVASDLILEIGRQVKGDGPITRQRFLDYMIGGLWGHKAPLPDSLEVLVLVGSYRDFAQYLRHDASTTVEEMMDWFDEGLAAMIRAKNTDMWECETRYLEESSQLEGAYLPEPEEGAGPAGYPPAYEAEVGPQYVYPGLKAIFIEPWESVKDILPTASKLWLQKSIEAGIERGIDIRTRTNVNPPRHRDLRFHVAPDRFDMRSDIRPPENQEFNPIRGKWVDRGCGNCGDCDDCFALFPKELWAQAYIAPQSAFEEKERTDGLGPQTEIWTRFLKEIQPTIDDRGNPIPEESLRDEQWMEEHRDSLPIAREHRFRVQKVDEYAYDRRCDAEEMMMWTPDYANFPPIGFPETARQRYQARAKEERQT